MFIEEPATVVGRCHGISHVTGSIGNKEIDMSRCWCRFALAVLVIVFAWLPVSWANIALTVLGGLLAVLALTGACCCASICKDSKPEPESEQEAAD
jgi:hypothetical protein